MHHPWVSLGRLNPREASTTLAKLASLLSRLEPHLPHRWGQMEGIRHLYRYQDVASPRDLRT